MVFAGLYPVESHEHGLLRDALEKLRLNDSAFNFEPENSAALGFGFRCGFLGLLHMEIIQERLEREFNIDLITTAPGVSYRVTLSNDEVIMVESPTKFPNPSEIKQIEEPIIDATVITLIDETGPNTRPLNEDVVIQTFDDRVIVEQMDPDGTQVARVVLTLHQLAELRLALNLPEGNYRIEKED